MKRNFYLTTGCVTMVALAALPIAAIRSGGNLQKEHLQFHEIRFMPENEPTTLPLVQQTSGPQRIEDSDSQVETPMIYGTVINSKAGTDGSAAQSKGMYTFDGSGNFSRKNTNATAQYGGAPMADGFYYAVSRTTKIYVAKFNTTTWKRTTNTAVTNNGLMASDVAYDPTSDMVYGCFYNDAANGYVFGKIDYAKRHRIAIKPLEMSYNAVMIDNAGQCYAIDITGNLLKIDKTTGDATSIGHTGVTPLYTSSATIDPNTGRCFWTVNPADGCGYLYEVDLTTGMASKIHTFVHSDEITGLYIPANTPAAEAPAAGTGLSASFSDGSMSGSVNITAPSTTSGGSALTGSISYSLWVNGVKVSDSACNAGENLQIPVTVTETGRTAFAVSFTNAAGESKRSYVKAFVGNDTPAAPTPALSYADGKFTVVWDKVTKAVNGGFIDPDRMTYTVVRMPDNITVAQNISDTSFTDPVSATPGRMIAYKYQVRATFEGNTGAAGTTPVYPLGEISTPWYEGFDSADAMENFIILDSNGDKTTWQYSGGMSSAYITNSSVQHDDWLISAAIRMEPGVTYKLAFEAMASFNPERIEVKMGKTPTPDGMTKTLVEPTDLAADFSMNSNVPEFTVDEAGLYYIGWHAISDANAFYLYVDNISLTDDAEHNADATEPPYLQEFNESAALAAFTVLDANNDGFMWNVDKGEARVQNGDFGMDDWLISPPLRLYAGNRYKISTDARSAMNEVQEIFEIKAGTAPTVEGMTIEVIPTTSVSTTEPSSVSAYFIPQEDGVYYFGIHGKSTEGYQLYIDNFAVAAPITGMSPAAPENMTLIPGRYGALSGTLSLTVPTKNVDGGSIGNIEKLVISKDGNEVQTIESPEAGATLNLPVEVDKAGVHTFEAVVYNYYGAGIPAQAYRYIGINKPSAPTDVVMTETEEPGKVKITWNAPVVDIEGEDLNPQDVKYIVAEVVNSQSLIIARDITDTSYELQSVAPGAGQQFKAYVVFAETSAGIGSGTASNMEPVGQAYTLPYEESFTNGAMGTAMIASQIVPAVGWALYNDDYGDVQSVDGDNGFVGMTGQNQNAQGALQTGKISLLDEDNPQFSFYVYNFSDQYVDDNLIAVQILLPDGNVDNLAQFEIYREFGTTKGWHKKTIDLTPYAGKTVRLAIGAKTMGYTNMLFDKFMVEHNSNVAVETIGADGWTIMSENGAIVIKCQEAANVLVSDMQGRVIFAGEIDGNAEIPVEAGIYIVNINGVSVKYRL